MRRLLALLAVLGTLFAIPGPVSGQSPSTWTIDVGGSEGTPEVYTLSADHVGDILITANHVVLDCAGFWVRGDGTQNGIKAFGTVQYPRISDVTIRNCNVTGHLSGIVLYYADDSTVENNYVELSTDTPGAPWIGPVGGIQLNMANGNTVRGNWTTRNAAGIIVFTDSDSNVIEDNLITKNEGPGIGIHSRSVGLHAEFNTIRGNEFKDNGSGIWMGGGHLNLVENNDFQGDGLGVGLYEAHGNLIQSNTMKGHEFWGVSLWESSNNEVLGNQATACKISFLVYDDGEIPGDTTSNLLIGNVAMKSRDGYVALERTSGNVFEENYVCKIKKGSLWADEGTNEWINNHDYCP